MGIEPVAYTKMMQELPSSAYRIYRQLQETERGTGYRHQN